jgi:hypothetical protein
VKKQKYSSTITNCMSSGSNEGRESSTDTILFLGTHPSIMLYLLIIIAVFNKMAAGTLYSIVFFFFLTCPHKREERDLN